jgi:hypothetical protein
LQIVAAGELLDEVKVPGSLVMDDGGRVVPGNAAAAAVTSSAHSANSRSQPGFARQLYTTVTGSWSTWGCFVSALPDVDMNTVSARIRPSAAPTWSRTISGNNTAHPCVTHGGVEPPSQRLALSM